MKEYVKKRPLRHDLVGSSCSAAMASLKQPKDVLELGVYLIRELGLERSTDTLARWMAHHLADRMEESKKAATPSDRRIARDECVELILKLWERRRQLPHSVDPLDSYKDVFAILKNLTLEPHPWVKPKGSRRQVLLAELRRDVNRLIRLLLVEKDTKDAARPEIPEIVVKFLPSEESKELDALQQFLGRQPSKPSPEDLLDSIEKGASELRQLLRAADIRDVPIKKRKLVRRPRRKST